MHGKLKEDFDCILDTFGGADGGTSFIYLMNALTKFQDAQEYELDEQAAALLMLVHRFAALIRAVQPGSLKPRRDDERS